MEPWHRLADIRKRIMARKRIKVSGRVLFTWFLLAGFVFLLAPPSITSTFQFGFARIFRWPLSFSRTVSLLARSPELPSEAVNRREQQYLNYIANLLQQLDQAHRRVEDLAGIRNRLPLEGADLMGSDVVTSTIKDSFCELIINRGREDGVAVGQFVLGDNSIVGTICDVSARQGRVRLFTDPDSALEVEIIGSDVYRVLTGAGKDTAKISMVPADEYAVKVGDWVFVRKTPGFLDSAMIVGIVDQCIRDTDSPLLWDITVKPACDLEKLNTVAVIIMNPDD
jgi:rod shape-determining protein MreC